MEEKNETNNDCPAQDPKQKYKNLKQIGKGAFSTVYHAIDKQNNEYAMKCISMATIEKYDINKFRLELEISLKMKHPNIVKAFQVFKTKKNWFIVTEYCNKGTLADIIKNLNSKKFSPEEREIICKKYLTQLKHALKYLHKNNIIHRDLKPNNILISSPNETDIIKKETIQFDILKLADFGFSRYFKLEDNNNSPQEDMLTSFCGTPLYMAPELLINKKYNSKADLWSFGVIMYEMLYGTNPYDYPKNLSNLLELMQTKKIDFPETYSKDCIQLLKSLLETDYKKRTEWKQFLKHAWFDKQIPSGFSKESCCSLDNIAAIESPSPKKIPNFTASDYQHLGDVQNEDDNEFEIINIDELSPCCYQSYKEEENHVTGLLHILSNSVKYLFGAKQ